MGIKLINIEHNKESFIQDDSTAFILTYEVKKWYYFGKVKTKTNHINIKNKIVMEWLEHIRQKTGVKCKQ